MPCSICAHPEAAAIAAAVSRGDSLRTIAGVYGVNKSSVSRHTRQCLTAVSVAPQADTTAPTMEQTRPTERVHHPTVHAEADRLYEAARRCYDITTLRRVVAELALMVAELTATGESAPQADEAAKRWNRL